MKLKPRSKDSDVLRFIVHIGGTLLTQMSRFVKRTACGRRNASQSGGLSVILLLKFFLNFSCIMVFFVLLKNEILAAQVLRQHHSYVNANSRQLE
jgi:hypothetical protein